MAASPRFDDDVAPLHEGWNRFSLDLNRLFDSECGQSREGMRAYARVSE